MKIAYKYLLEFFYFYFYESGFGSDYFGYIAFNFTKPLIHFLFFLGLQRCGKSCRLRWTNYLRPDIKRGKFSLQEEQTIIQLHALLGNR